MEITPIQMFRREMEREAQTTKKFLSIIPEDKYEWQPHPKSMKLIQLVTHIAELPTWFELILTTNGIDFEANEYKPKQINNNAELMAHFEESLENGLASLDKYGDVDLWQLWPISSGAMVFTNNPRLDEMRNTASQVVHHRAQLGVYLRLLNVPIPGSYGPSSDEM
ncbi:MAG: hypothetical protein KDC49_10365 [Saprospiraceae bacterium]|nr:hypothetical protein [Saprospiraceae bacterium]